MGLLLSDDPEACRPPASASAYGAGQRVAVPRIAPRGPDFGGDGAYARPLEVVVNAYRPRDRNAALQAQREFGARQERWRAGVDDTSFFPHSAICHFEIDYPSGGYWGTGFYIAPDRILTCAHNVKSVPRNEEARSIRVYPGRNGQNGVPNAPFTVRRADMAVHERYDGGFDWDLAVLRVSTPPPGGEYFDVLEEQRQSVPAPIVVCGYSAQAGADPYKQHMDGDTIRRVEDQTFYYNLQTTPGASGSPVYYVDVYEDHERQMSVPQAVITAVHVASADPGDPDKGVLNRGCRLTDEKIGWIRSRFAAPARTEGLGYTRALGRSVDFNWDGVPLIGQPNGMACWATAGAMLQNWANPAAPQSPVQMADRAGLRQQYDQLVGIFPDQMRAFATAAGLVPADPQSYSIDAFIQLLETQGPLWVSAITPMYHVIVVTGVHSDGAADGSDTVVRIHDPWDRAPGAPGAPGAYRNQQGGGSRYLLNWADFVRMYESRATNNAAGDVNVQIIHAGGTGGRTPNYSPDPAAFTYALGGGATAGALAIEHVDADQLDTVRREFVANAAAANRQNCINIVNTAMRALYGSRITGGLGSTIQDTMKALQGYGLAGTAEVFEFLDASGRVTRGVVRPDRLQRSVESWILDQADANQVSGFYLFGLSVMDGYHSVILGVEFSGKGNPATQIYWADQVHGGWDPVVGQLDARITSKTQGWWDPLPQDRKARTRVTLWPLAR
jgi:V8-like Glu-specific endopeptidase